MEKRRVFAAGKKPPRGPGERADSDDADERERRGIEERARKILAAAKENPPSESDRSELKGLLRTNLLSPKLRREARAVIYDEKNNEYEEIRKALKNHDKPEREDQWEKFLSLPFSILVEKLDSRELKRFLNWVGNAEDRFQSITRDYIIGEFDAESIRKTGLKKKSLIEKAGNVADAARRGKTLAVWEATHKEIRTHLEPGEKLIEKEGMLSGPTKDAETKVDVERMRTKTQEMLAAISRAGFGADVIDKANQAAEKQLGEIDVNVAKERDTEFKVRESIYQTLREDISARVLAAEKSGAQEYLKLIPEIREQCEMFVGMVAEAATKDFKTKDQAAKFIRGEVEASFRIAETYCNWIEKGASEAEILEKLTPDDGVKQEDKEIIRALSSYLGKIGEKASGKRVEYQAARSTILEKIQEAKATQGDKARADLAIEKAAEIAKETKVPVHEIWEALLSNDLPEPKEYELIVEWAREHKISTNEAERIILAVQPAAEIIDCSRTEFIAEALDKWVEDQKKLEGEGGQDWDAKKAELLGYLKKNPNSFVHRFAANKGDLQRTLLKEASRELITTPAWLLGHSVDAMNGATISKEELNLTAKKAQDSVEMLRKNIKPELERMKDMVQKIKELRKEKIQPEQGQTPGAEEADSELHRIQKLFELVTSLNEDADIDSITDQTSILDRPEVLATLQEVTQKSEEFLRSSSSESIVSEIARVLTIAEERVGALTGIDGKEAIKKLAPLGADLSRFLSKDVREKQEKEKNDRKEKLQQFADWVMDGKIPDGVENILTFVASLENLSGKKVLKLVPDDKLKEGIRAEIHFESDGFEIWVRESEWKDTDLRGQLETSLRHEGWHAVDAATGYDLSKEVFEVFQKVPSSEQDHVKRALASRGYTDANSKDFREELLAYVLSGEVGATTLKNELTAHEEWQVLLNRAKTQFGENGAERGIFGGTKVQARSAAMLAPTEQVLLNPNNNPSYNAEFRLQVDTIRKDLKSISLSNADGKDEFIAEVESELQYLESIMAGPEKVTDNQFKEIMEVKLKKLKNHKIIPAISEIAEKESAGGGYFVEVWENTTFLSVADIGAMWNIGKDWVKRRHERKEKYRVGKAGKPLMDKIAKELANEYDNTREAAEIEEVEHFEKGLKNKDAWQVMDRLDETKTKDELKACLNVLSERGQIDWYDRRIWRALERFQRPVKFRDSDADDPNALRSKLHRACGLLWDYDYFAEKDRHNNDSYDSTKNKFAHEVEANDGIMDRIIQGMLMDRKNGGKVEPQRYEAYVEGAIKLGKSTPENVFWYMLQGLHFGILSMDRINIIDAKQLNTFPPVQWFYEKKPTADQIHGYAEMFPPGDHGSVPSNFNDWFFTHVMTNKYVRERVQKSVAQASEKWDHDWFGTFGSTGTSNTYKSLLQLNHGQPKLPPTGYPNAVVGQLTFITTIARYGGELGDDELKEEVARHLSMSAMYNSLVMGRATKKGEEYYTFDDYERGHPPRSGAKLYTGGDKEMTTEEMVDQGNEIIAALGPEFKFITEKGPMSDDEAQKIGERLRARYLEAFVDTGMPQTSMELMDRLEGVINLALKEPGALENVLEQAQSCDATDHPKTLRANRYGQLDYGRAHNWRGTYQDTVGRGATKNKGMFSLYSDK